MYFNNVLHNTTIMESKSPLKSLASSWTRRRWLDFRNGHSIYLIFLMTFANFVVIQYGLLIDRVPFLSNMFGSIWIFAIIYICLYVPIAMVIGYWHRKTQWRVEQHALFKENEIGATMWLFVIDLIDGKVSEGEKQEMRNMLYKILRKPVVKPAAEPTEQTESQK